MKLKDIELKKLVDYCIDEEIAVPFTLKTAFEEVEVEVNQPNFQNLFQTYGFKRLDKVAEFHESEWKTTKLAFYEKEPKIKELNNEEIDPKMLIGFKFNKKWLFNVYFGEMYKPIKIRIKNLLEFIKTIEIGRHYDKKERLDRYLKN